MALTYGTDGVKQKDYDVYIGLSNLTGLQAAITSYLSTPTKALFDAINAISGMARLGECRADSIDLGIDKGDTVDGNNLGEIVLNKACAFAAELMNATPTNIAALELLDGNACTITLQEVDTHTVGGTGSHKTCVLLNDLIVSYTEKITGGDSIRSTINIARNVPSAGSFRHIADLDQA